MGMEASGAVKGMEASGALFSVVQLYELGCNFVQSTADLINILMNLCISASHLLSEARGWERT